MSASPAAAQPGRGRHTSASAQPALVGHISPVGPISPVGVFAQRRAHLLLPAVCAASALFSRLARVCPGVPVRMAMLCWSPMSLFLLVR